MQVIKRSGKKEAVSFNKIINRIKAHTHNLVSIDPIIVAQKVVSQLYDGVSTCLLDELTAEVCVHLGSVNPDYGILAKRIIISNNHKETPDSFSKCIEYLYQNKDTNGNHNPLISKRLYNMVMTYRVQLDRYIQSRRDYQFDYFAFKTLEKSYLFRVGGKVVERIQYLFMRVSLGLHLNHLENGLRSYDGMSQKLFIHGSPTLFHSGTDNPQLLSCFLLGTGDSVSSIYQTIGDCAQISKWAGGIGVHISNIRSKNSLIRGTNGKSNGIVPMLQVYNATARYINQGGKRNGSIAVYLEPHHPDIMSFLELRKNHGNESERTRDLFTALWVPDLFMKRVEEDSEWSLFDPDRCLDLTELYGEAYERKYIEYERAGIEVKRLPARTIWQGIIQSQTETGTPYILYKDNVNKYNNQANLGTIKSSNLCAEITEYSNDKEYACCTLASLGLPKCVVNGEFDFTTLGEVVETVVVNLNRVIDINRYPLPQTATSNYRHRPIGIGIQGLADVFALLHLPFESLQARHLNMKIFETIYYYSLKASCQLAKDYGNEKREFLDIYADLLGSKSKDTIISEKIKKIKAYEPTDKVSIEKHTQLIDFIREHPSIEYEDENGYYSSYLGSPLSKGVFQYELRDPPFGECNYPLYYDWDGLRNDIKVYGVRNSLLTALMPTASTSQILGNNECFEPFTSHLYVRRTLAGDFVMVNQHLVAHLSELGLWNREMKDTIIRHNGSIANIDNIPLDVRNLYKTVWEISQKSLIQLAIDRSPFICQTQSMNLWFKQPNMKNLTSALFFSWKKGLKTGCYYVRSQPKAQAQQFSIALDTETKDRKYEYEKTNDKIKKKMCSLLNPEGCMACSS